MIRKLLPTIGLLACLLLTVQVARADNYTFSTNNFGQVGSLGTVTTSLSGGSIIVLVNMAPGYVIHGAGVGLNVNPLFSGITITNINPASIFTQDLNSHQFDGFGSFVPSVASNQSTAQARASNTNLVAFQVNTTTAGGFTNAGQIFSFAVQVSPLVDNGATGFALTTRVNEPPSDDDDPPEVPEPASMMLLGTGLVGLAGFARKRYRRSK